MHRAFREWSGEEIVWILPGLDQVRRWIDGDASAVAVPGEQYELIRVCHVGRNRAVVGPLADEFPGGSVESLLDAWLNSAEVRFAPTTAQGAIQMPVPVFHDGRVEHEARRILIGQGSVLPFRAADDGERRVVVAWPPDRGGATPVSPETESAMVGGHGHSATRALPMRIEWSSPFDRIMPVISTLDDHYARDMMRYVAEMTGDNHEAAVTRARQETSAWLSEGRSTVRKSWFDSLAAANGLADAMIAANYRYRVAEHKTLADAERDETWRKKLSEKERVRRAWGIPGLMWALLQDRLQGIETYRYCLRCGWRIEGRANKMYCSRVDNQECSLARERENKQRTRRQGRR